MIISHKHQFIYIKCRKTAGTSVEISLSQLCGKDDIITPITEKDENKKIELGLPAAQNHHQPKKEWNFNQWYNYLKTGKKHKHFYHHISCKELIELVPPKIWNSYFKFTVERNPFDKIASLYFWRKADEKYKLVSDYILDGGLDRIPSYDLYSINKLPAVDKIYRYEDLAFFEKDLTKQLCLATPFRLVDYKAKNKTRKVKDYKQVLDDKAIDLIKIAFAREIELLGYKY